MPRTTNSQAPVTIGANTAKLWNVVKTTRPAIPDIGSDGIGWTPWLVVALVAAGVAALATALTRPLSRVLEPVGAVVVLVVAVLIALWSTGTDTSSVDAADWAHAAVAVVAYVALAVGLVALGTVRDQPHLTARLPGQLLEQHTEPGTTSAPFQPALDDVAGQLELLLRRQASRAWSGSSAS